MSAFPYLATRRTPSNANCRISSYKQHAVQSVKSFLKYLEKDSRIDATVIFAVICDLRPPPPNNLSSGGHKAEFTHYQQNKNIFLKDGLEDIPLTSMIVPFVRTPNCVYMGFWGFFNACQSGCTGSLECPAYLLH